MSTLDEIAARDAAAGSSMGNAHVTTVGTWEADAIEDRRHLLALIRGARTVIDDLLDPPLWDGTGAYPMLTDEALVRERARGFLARLTEGSDRT